MKKFISIQIFFVLIIATLLGVYLYKSAQNNKEPAHPVAILTASSTNSLVLSPAGNVGKYSLINAAVTADVGKHFIINFKPLEDQFTKIKTKFPQKTYSYFVYLNNAAWIGSNEETMFTAASTIKVPLSMSIMKMAEEGKLSLTQLYTLDQLDLNKDFGDLYKVGADKSFTINDLMKIMLENSDNTAMNALYKVLKLVGVEDPFSNVYSFMGWEGATDFGKTPQYNLINLKTLSNMFVSLYNAKYDNVEDSNTILSYLDQSIFNDQIPAGVPTNISVAHKIGVNDQDQTYSDCGIVYAPSRHFLICLGSQGVDKKTANSFMSQMSKAAYDYVMNN